MKGKKKSHKSELLGSLLTFVVLVGILYWLIYGKDVKIRSRVWEGKITDRYTEMNWWGLLPSRRRRLTSRERHLYYWKVTTDDGQEIHVEVPRSTWEASGIGDRVRKVEGDYYPERYTPKPSLEEDLFGVLKKSRQ
jgi:hypothetical protein